MSILYVCTTYDFKIAGSTLFACNSIDKQKNYVCYCILIITQNFFYASFSNINLLN